MDFSNINKKNEFYSKHKHLLMKSPGFIKSFEESFSLKYTHESTALEGNSLTLNETKDVLINKKSVAGKDLRELYEVINHDKAFHYIRKALKEGKQLDDAIVSSIHENLMERIQKGGIYRNMNVYISGSQNDLPDYYMVPRLMKEFYQDLAEKTALCNMKVGLHPVELACWTHATFINIHPFSDGNGRTARLMMNYQLMQQGYLPVSIPKEIRSEYCKALDTYQSSKDMKDMEPFVKIVADLEEKQLDEIIKTEKSLLKANELEQ